MGVEEMDLATIGPEMLRLGRMLLLDRTYRGKTFRRCFVAEEAVELIASRWRVSRQEAVAIGRSLQSAGLVHHVAREQPFADAFLFFRFGAGAERLARLDLAALAREMRGPSGVEIRDRTYLGRRYPACFVGRAGVDWLCARLRTSVGEAESVGEAMRERGLLAHVVDEHPFMDGGLFYRFRGDAA